MTIFIVSYDLIKHKDYQKLTDAIETYSSCKVLESLWLIKSNLSVKEIRNHLNNHIDEDDRLIVFQALPVAAWTGNLSQSVDECLRANL
ncbi:MULTISPECIES: hypothetical protein [unclassified Methylophilus]|uniref:hypothetical protein n=1 Tax=unclassified Methylophilus TaxID=2630143 RepID=UPI0007009D9B|nr:MULTISPECIES: hypothetical protein [unclassified Methylophilus]KQT42229.1 hypothetical protein ASG34_05575 [Methylophilus sp. Leaf416]KQT56411.1 hypothetical protein ASG44_05550 [Methylophilus sp. Leaf459]